MTASPKSYDQLVCSGGGTRCFWQGGFLDAVRDRMDLRPDRISAVSGGALTAAGFIAHTGHAILDRMCDAFSALDSNLDLHAIVDGPGLSIHQQTYFDVVSDVFNEAACSRVADGPVFQILIGHPPTGRLSKVTGTAATLAYEAELHLINSPHFNWAEKIGVSSTLVDARTAARDGTLVDLICAAAVIPPLFDLPQWDGKPVIDGGMADQAPMPDPDQGSTLVLLTRNYRRTPEVEGRLYLQPEKETDADKIDFTDPAKIRRTWDNGTAFGKSFLD